MVRRNDSFALQRIQQTEVTLFERPDSRAPFGHPDRCLVGISLILLCPAWSKLDVQVVVCDWLGNPFKAWVAGSSPAALTSIIKQSVAFCFGLGRNVGRNLLPPREDCSFIALRHPALPKPEFPAHGHPSWSQCCCGLDATEHP
jgi:hypothetical protein